MLIRAENSKSTVAYCCYGGVLNNPVRRVEDLSAVGNRSLLNWASDAIQEVVHSQCSLMFVDLDRTQSKVVRW